MSDYNIPAWETDTYELLDFGNGRKLERFGDFILDRNSPAAEAIRPLNPAIWQRAHARFPGHVPDELSRPWGLRFRLYPSLAQSELNLQLKLTPFGHVGIFPEQFGNWQWLFNEVRYYQPTKLRALNLFAYTGAATLAMAAAGAEVVHIDSSSPAVAWARKNAHLSGLDGCPIRWIVEDAFKFLAREFRRGAEYDVIVLDPPSFGHTASGKNWSLAERWQELLTGCLQLLPIERRCLLLWTGHSVFPSTEQLSDRLMESRQGKQSIGRSELTTATGRKLDAGYFLRAELAGHCPSDPKPMVLQ